MIQNLVDRYELGEVPSKDTWFRYGDYSILDCGKLMETHPMKKEMIDAGMFVGWEALDKKGNTTRADNWEKLKQLI